MSKGSKSRITNKQHYDKNYSKINWGRKDKALDHEFHTKQKDTFVQGVPPQGVPKDR